MSRAISILMLLAVLFQASPLRACAWAEVVVGWNCHENELTASAPVCIGHPAESSGELCVCEAGTDNAVRTRGMDDDGVSIAPPMPAVAISFMPVGESVRRSPPERIEPPPPGRVLPLLN